MHDENEIAYTYRYVTMLSDNQLSSEQRQAPLHCAAVSKLAGYISMTVIVVFHFDVEELRWKFSYRSFTEFVV